MSADFFNQLFNEFATFAVAGISIVVSLILLYFALIPMLGQSVRRRIETVTHDQHRDEFSKTSLSLSDRIDQGDDKELDALQRQFIYAGFKYKKALSVYKYAKIALAAGLPAVAYLITAFFPNMNEKYALLAVMGAGALGFILPGLYLDHRVKSRQAAILNGFPDMLDLLVACSEAGLGLNAALQRVSREISLSFPELAGEMQAVNLEIRAGADRMDALKNFANRTGIDEISGLVAMLRQSIRFGTGIADTLRIYAEEFRDIRMQRAEAIAASVGTKMIFPLVLCIFPAFFVVSVGPAAIKIIEVFSAT